MQYRTYGRISQYSSRGGKNYRRVTLRIRREKKRGHTHEEYETKNLRGQTVIRCHICKFHYIFLYLNT